MNGSTGARMLRLPSPSAVVGYSVRQLCLEEAEARGLRGAVGHVLGRRRRRRWLGLDNCRIHSRSAQLRKPKSLSGGPRKVQVGVRLIGEPVVDRDDHVLTGVTHRELRAERQGRVSRREAVRVVRLPRSRRLAGVLVGIVGCHHRVRLSNYLNGHH
jgi:hypothetical protein